MLPLWVLLVLAAASPAPARDAGPDLATRQRLLTMEEAIARDPENLKLAADYRQLVIAAAEFDRSTRLFERLAKQKGSGPNVQISLALAYVDKVPVTSRIRHVYLGRDAMSALSRAIDRQPTPLAYFVRGLINLFYNNFMFHRAQLGIDDLQRALSLVRTDTPPALVERILVALGDGYWRAENTAKAREIWSTAAARFPASPALAERLRENDQRVGFAVRHALDEDIRVDTSLVDMLPAR
jgi:tetratricopeptide (TPR) repeat protein